jgi:hypothetical protein
MANKTLQPTVPPSLCYGGMAAEVGRKPSDKRKPLFPVPPALPLLGTRRDSNLKGQVSQH